MVKPQRIHVPEGQRLQIYVRSDSGALMLIELPTKSVVSVVLKSANEIGVLPLHQPSSTDSID
jgi:predicted regulator of Ras-like GTPase activity (Roadblock/LC7/MglB family)